MLEGTFLSDDEFILSSSEDMPWGVIIVEFFNDEKYSKISACLPGTKVVNITCCLPMHFNASHLPRLSELYT